MEAAEKAEAPRQSTTPSACTLDMDGPLQECQTAHVPLLVYDHANLFIRKLP